VKSGTDWVQTFRMFEVIATANAIGLPSAFVHWLSDNAEMWRTFAVLADRMRAVRPRYSARAILHVLRWEHAIAERPEGEFKINNDKSARLARLYNALAGADFFQERNGSQY
jgi:hypothetical protein